MFFEIGAGITNKNMKKHNETNTILDLRRAFIAARDQHQRVLTYSSDMEDKIKADEAVSRLTSAIKALNKIELGDIVPSYKEVVA